jgi:hypothetical protein
MRRTSSAVTVDFDGLLAAIEWVTAESAFGNAAYIRRDDGRTFWIGDGAEKVEDAGGH